MSLGRVGSRGGRAASRPGARDPLIIALVPCQQNQRSSPLPVRLCLAIEKERTVLKEQYKGGYNRAGSL